MAFLHRTTGWMILVTVLLIYLSGLHCVSGVRCVICMSPTVPPEWTGLVAQKMREELPDCKEKTVKKCSLDAICAKTDTTIDGKKYVIRRCEFGGEEGECKEEQQFINGKMQTGRICFCNKDECNEGSSFKNDLSKNYMLFLGTIFIITGLYWC